MFVWEWSRMHISEHFSVLWFASIAFPFGGGGVRYTRTNSFKARKPLARSHMLPFDNRTEMNVFLSRRIWGTVAAEEDVGIYFFFDDFSIVDWRIETFVSFCLWIRCTGWLIAQYFQFLSPARFNMQICCGHRITQCLQWSGLLKLTADWNQKTHLIRTDVTEDRTITCRQVFFSVLLMAWNLYMLLVLWLLLLVSLLSNCFFCFRSRSYPAPHRGERVKQRTVHARNWYQS